MACRGGTISGTSHTETTGGISVGMSGSVNISGNTVTGHRMDNPGSVLFGIAGMDVTDIQVESNEIANITNSTEGISSSGIYFTNGTDLRITGNEITGPLSGGGVSLTDCTHSEIEGNTITGQMSGGGVLLTDCTQSDIEGNTITCSSSGGGIFLNNNIDSEIRRNSVRGSTYGIILEGEQTDISDNSILSAGMVGISVKGGPGIISNNTVVSSPLGIMLSMDDSFILNNTIHDDLLRGLSISGTNLTLSRNNLTNNTVNFYIDGDRIEHYLHHIDRTNMIDGRPLVYLRDSTGDTIGQAENPAMVLAARCENITITNITTGANIAGVLLANVTNATVSGLTDTGSMTGVRGIVVEGMQNNADFQLRKARPTVLL